MSQTKDTIKSLRKQNDDLKNEIDTLRDEFRKFEDSVASKGNSHDAQKCQTPSVETQKSLDYLGNEYDDLNRFSKTAKQQISRLESRLAEIADKVELVSNSIDEAQQYSYSYNVKVAGIPHLKQKESARDTSDLCIKWALHYRFKISTLLTVCLQGKRMIISQSRLFASLHGVLLESKLWR
jgi:predicted  nucleic acid-binding Zn-ribbon protein